MKLVESQLEHSLVYNVKRIGEITHPCGTPVLIPFNSDKVLLTLTCNVRLVKNENTFLLKMDSLSRSSISELKGEASRY